MGALAVWCTRWLSAPPAAELFKVGYLSTVKGLRLTDGREVVVKVRPRGSRLAGCAVVHRALWTAGFPCPEPLVDLQPLDGYAATAKGSSPAPASRRRKASCLLCRRLRWPGSSSWPDLAAEGTRPEITRAPGFGDAAPRLPSPSARIRPTACGIRPRR